jgi:hypothetical protein
MNKNMMRDEMRVEREGLIGFCDEFLISHPSSLIGFIV